MKLQVIDISGWGMRTPPPVETLIGEDDFGTWHPAAQPRKESWKKTGIYIGNNRVVVIAEE